MRKSYLLMGNRSEYDYDEQNLWEKGMRCIFVLVALLAFFQAHAESIDIGRGEIPVVVPAGYDKSQPAPLVVLLHGYTSSGANQESYFKLSALADEFGFIFVAPDGTVEKQGDRNRFWNAGPACCNLQASTVNDSAYLKTLIEALQNRYSIDAKRIYMSGHSNGGFMVHRMAYDYPETLAAIVALNGAAPNRWMKARPSSPVAILHIHGTADTVTPYEGGEISGVPYTGAVNGLRNWAYYAHGNASQDEAVSQRDLASDIEGAETKVTAWADSRIELWTIEGGKHVPAFQEDFNRQIVEWMYAHPKL